jgi:lysophospholipase L1-like esterase
MTRRRHLAFAAIALGLSTVLTLGAIVTVDVVLHRKYTATGGLNVWGYRGPVVGRKRIRESRIVVLGGSTAFGYGVTWNHAFPAVLESLLREQGRRVSVVNLAYNNEGAYAYRPNLVDYGYLRYDVVLFYTGYNDLIDGNRTVFRRESPVFRLTGYLPILPLVLREKAMALRHGGNLEEAYRTGQAGRQATQFTPTALDRGKSAGLDALARISASLERQLGRLTDIGSVEETAVATTCDQGWNAYCRHMRSAIEEALARGARVLVVGQPYISDGHVTQQMALEKMLRQRFGADPRVRLVNLGRALDLCDRALAWDGMHLTAAGNAHLAALLAGPVGDLLP